MTKLNEELKSLRAMSVEALNEEIVSLRKKQFLLRLKRKTEGVLEKPHQLTTLRKQIARIKTVMTEKAGEQDVN